MTDTRSPINCRPPCWSNDPGTGEVLTFSTTGGDALDAADDTPMGVAASSTTFVSGAGVTFDLTIESGAVTDAQLSAAGADYEAGDEITISIADLASTSNDLVITIDTVDEDTTGSSVTVTADVDSLA